jgi:hypothetical protein
MCGTGVLQAMGGLGARAVIFRILFFTVMFLFHEAEKLNRTSPDSPLTSGMARLVLLGSPVLLLSIWGTFSAFNAIDVQEPVNCCAVVYDSFRELADAGTAAGFPAWYWTAAFGVASIMLIASAVMIRKPDFSRARRRAAIAAISSILWVLVAAMALVKVFAAYYYQVLHHNCPWCLFLPEHYLAGFALFGLLTAVALEGPSGLVLLCMTEGIQDLHARAVLRVRKSGLRILLSASLFLLLVSLPPVLWRIRFGVWMG